MIPAVIWLLILFGLFCIYDCKKPANFPPGPRWLPLVGCFPRYQRVRSKYNYNYMAFQELSREYGPIVGMKLGKQKYVFICTHDMVKKMLLHDDLNGRPDGFFFRVRAFGKRIGVLFTEGNTWSQHRRFTMRHLKTFGLGQATMEKNLIFESECLIEYLREQSKVGPVAMHKAFDIAVLNAIWTLFAGHRFDYHDEKAYDILNVVHKAFRLTDTLGGIVSLLPFLRFVIPELSGYKELLDNSQKLWEFIDEEIYSHEKDIKADQPRDLIDAFLMEIKSQKGSSLQSDSIFNRQELVILCLDIFLAGSKTTTDTLGTIFAFLSLHPEWVKILQDSLEKVVGNNRAPSLSDRPLLPLVDAFLAECQRFLLLAPLGVPHKATKDVMFNGYRIPEDTVILPDFHSVHNDETYWENPEEFRPERFLDENNQFRQNHAAIPFGIGKRRCLGEALARSSLFLFFTHVIHNFDFKISPEHGAPNPNGYDGFTISPKPYYLIVSLRSDINQNKIKENKDEIVKK
ncbi:methyl farnesoate epoxidase-like [Belonocnema kinseyi]|uniref:methyl farnesoate epoxidase-like n=1 Tax=Belonocnema kinseyi TaxID=2817044 RepID=UPI00143D0F00|nr:methyl farnesoate epoxidase-like [Belonocnema kinseyi]